MHLCLCLELFHRDAFRCSDERSNVSTGTRRLLIIVIGQRQRGGNQYTFKVLSYAHKLLEVTM
jgi:hypothetical protein